MKNIFGTFFSALAGLSALSASALTIHEGPSKYEPYHDRDGIITTFMDGPNGAITATNWFGKYSAVVSGKTIYYYLYNNQMTFGDSESYGDGRTLEVRAFQPKVYGDDYKYKVIGKNSYGDDILDPYLVFDGYEDSNNPGELIRPCDRPSDDAPILNAVWREFPKYYIPGGDGRYGTAWIGLWDTFWGNRSGGNGDFHVIPDHGSHGGMVTGAVLYSFESPVFCATFNAQFPGYSEWVQKGSEWFLEERYPLTAIPYTITLVVWSSEWNNIPPPDGYYKKMTFEGTATLDMPKDGGIINSVLFDVNMPLGETLPEGSYNIFLEIRSTLSERTPDYILFHNCFIVSDKNLAVEVAPKAADWEEGSLTLHWRVADAPDMSDEESDSIIGVRGKRFNIWRATGEGYDSFDNATLVGINQAGAYWKDSGFDKIGGTYPVKYWVQVLTGDEKNISDKPSNAPAASCVTRRRYVLSVGVGDCKEEMRKSGKNKNGEDPHVHASLEAKKFDDLMSKNKSDFAFRRLRLDSEAKRETLMADIYSIRDEIKPGDEFFFFISTHGFDPEYQEKHNPNGNSWTWAGLCLYDAHYTKEMLWANMVGEKKIQGLDRTYVTTDEDAGMKLDGSSGVKTTVIINACYSESMIPVEVSDRLTNTIWFTCAKSTEPGNCDRIYSQFGQAFLDWGWVRGYADSAVLFGRDGKYTATSGHESDMLGNEDGKLSVQEAFDYAYLLCPGRSDADLQHVVLYDPAKLASRTILSEGIEHGVVKRPSPPKFTIKEDKSKQRVYTRQERFEEHGFEADYLLQLCSATDWWIVLPGKVGGIPGNQLTQNYFPFILDALETILSGDQVKRLPNCDYGCTMQTITPSGFSPRSKTVNFTKTVGGQGDGDQNSLQSGYVGSSMTANEGPDALTIVARTLPQADGKTYSCSIVVCSGSEEVFAFTGDAQIGDDGSLHIVEGNLDLTFETDLFYGKYGNVYIGGRPADVYDRDEVFIVTLDGQNGDVPDALIVAKDAPSLSLPEPVKSGFAFDGWFTESIGGVKIYENTAITGDVTFYAHWRIASICFASTEVTTAEGGKATVRIVGGTTNAATSVKLYLAYNTATAADLNLAKGAVDGQIPKGGLKFPLTLKWAKGEVGEKIVTIPVKSDALVDGAEFLTLQLATPSGMELGEDCMCTVTIADANAAVTANPLSEVSVSPGVTLANSGYGTWEVVAAEPGDPTSGRPCKLLSPVVPVGSQKATLAVNGVKGAGLLRVAYRFVYGDDVDRDAVRATFDIMDGKKLMYDMDNDMESDGWHIADVRLTGKGAHLLKMNFFPWDEGDVRLEIAGVRWAASGAAQFFLRRECDPVDAGQIAGGGYIAKNAKATVKAVANPGWAFSEWVDGDGKVVGKSATYTVKKMVRDLLLTARFVPKYYARVMADSPAGGSTSGQGRYVEGAKVTLKAKAAKGYVFAGWFDGEMRLSRKETYSFQMPAYGVEYTAKFVSTAEDKASIVCEFGDMDWGSKHVVTNLCGVVASWPIAADALTPTSITIKGQPKGMSLKNGMVTGVPGVVSTKTATMAITVKSSGGSKTYKVDWFIAPLPKEAVGMFNGFGVSPVGATNKVTVTSTSVGKITGKFGPYSLAKTGWTIGEDGLFSAVLTKTRTEGAGKKKKTYKDTMTVLLDPYEEWTSDQAYGEFCTTAAGDVDWVWSARRNPYGDKNNADAKAMLAEFRANLPKTVTLGGVVWNFKVDAKGVATISRTKNKKTVSATAVVNFNEDGSAYATFFVDGKAVRWETLGDEQGAD